MMASDIENDLIHFSPLVQACVANESHILGVDWPSPLTKWRIGATPDMVLTDFVPPKPVERVRLSAFAQTAAYASLVEKGDSSGKDGQD